jgi:hypothetical protein
MQQGGWAKPDIAMRYMHVGTPELGGDVRAYCWEMRAGAAVRPPARPAAGRERLNTARVLFPFPEDFWEALIS